MTDRIADLDDVDDDDDGGGSGDRSGAAESTSPDEPSSHAADGRGESRDRQEPVERPTAAPSTRWARHRERRRNRVSKWDRPPDPKDWRYFVGALGKVLIATGVLMFGFVAYQLWGTGIETARAQNRLENAFEEAVAANADRDDEPPAAPDTTAVPDDAETVDEPNDEPDVDATDPDVDATDPDVDEEPLPELPEPVPSQIIPGGVDLSDVAVDQDVPPIARGDVIARLQIPKIDKDLYVVAGVTLDDLKDGPGHYPDSPLPGQLGNASIAGHRTTYGAPFFDVDQLAAGDQLIVTSITGDRFVYEVTGVQVVSADDYWVVTTRDPTVAELTLTSCHPKYTARDRIVVHSVLVPELSANVGVAEFYEIDDTSEAIPGDDPTLSEPDDAEAAASDEDAPQPSTEGTIVATIDDDAAVDLTAGDETREAQETPIAADEPTEDATAGSGTTPPVQDETDGIGEVPAAPEPGTVEQPEQIDPFTQGWFDDDEAWPQIALWGFALTIISLLAYQVSKRTRHDSIGFLVGIGPFLFCLYFFFQNVNRLLPPGL